MITLERDEKLIFCDTFHEEGSAFPATFAVTDRAIFVTREKHLARESFVVERIPLMRVRQVFLSRRRWRSMIISSALLIAFGVALGIFMVIPLLKHEETAKFSVLPFVLVALGAALPFLRKESKTLVVQLNDGIYKWKPKITLHDYSRARIQGLQEQFLAACRRAGVYVMEEIEY